MTIHWAALAVLLAAPETGQLVGRILTPHGTPIVRRATLHLEPDEDD